MALWTRLVNGFRKVISLVLPVFGKAGDFRKLGPGLRWTFHVLLVILILLCLWYLNVRFDLEKVLRAPWPMLRKVWLPLLFLLVYILSWLGWWFWKLFEAEEDMSGFADIDESWAEAVRALDHAGIELSRTPLFLVLGRPAESEEGLFGAAQLPFQVYQAPRRPNSPLHVYANRDGIYVSCAGASLLGRQAALLAEAAETNPQADGPRSPRVQEEDRFKTLDPKGRFKDMQAILARAREQGRGPDDLTEEEKREIGLLLAQEDASVASRPMSGKARTPLLKNAAEADLLTARLKHLCRLIVRDRRPFCPINGMLLLIPLAAMDSDEDASQTGLICQRDLAIAREALQVRCPLYAMVCDLEKAVGFRNFIARLPEGQRGRRMGQRFPLAPDVDAEALPGIIERMVLWICNNLLPSFVYKLFDIEPGPRETPADVIRHNTGLYRLLGQFRERQKRLGRILVRGVVLDAPQPLMFGGCYLAATGRDSAREQAFVAGVFQRLAENQNFVAWTNEALAEEADYRRWIGYGYIIILILLAALIAMGYIFWQQLPAA